MSLLLISEEIDVLKAIFCQENEFKLHTEMDCVSESDDYQICFAINITFEHNHHHEQTGCIEVVFCLDRSYPEKINNIALNSVDLSKKQLGTLKSRLNEHIQDLTKDGNDEQKILQIVELIKNHIETDEEFKNDSVLNTLITSKNDDDIKKETEKLIVLKLDHMRSKQKYSKTISNWATSLGLSGRLLFFGRLILIVLHGASYGITEYLKKHRTCVVDVDSNGRPCKERMMDVIMEVNKRISSQLLNGFQIMEFETKEKLINELKLFDIQYSDLQQ